jgi:signal transduction histidine kinase
MSHPQALLSLMWLASPALPIGGFSYSEGLEAAVDAGLVHDEASAGRWLTDQLHLTLARADLTVLARFGGEEAQPVEITDLEQAVQQRTRELADALEVAQSANRAKTTFLGTVSHELRTPLNAVIGFSTLLLDGSIVEPLAEQRKPLSVIRQAGQHLLDLVQEILDLSSIEAGNLTVAPAPVDMRALLEESRDSMLLKATEQELELRPVVCEPGLLVLADRKRLGQVVRNLLSNALKFTDQGFVQVRASSTGGSVRVEIVDTGVGIPAELQSCLFQPFYRITGGQAQLRPGTGLGLAISRRIVEAMGGAIGCESEAGRGSCFWFTLPSAREP